MNHPETGGVIEIFLVQPDRSVVFYFDEMILDQLNKFVCLFGLGLP